MLSLLSLHMNNEDFVSDHAIPIKKSKMRGIYAQPDGLVYFPEFISLDQEKNLLKFVADLDYQEVRIHNQPAKRTVKHYGYKYDYQAVKLVPGEPFPGIIKDLRNKCADLACLDHEDIVQCLISFYPAHAGIGWHTDKLLFGPKIIGISLQSACMMRFQRKIDAERFVFEQELLPRSAYIITGSSRYDWEHSIPPVKEARYSIVFRTLK